MAKNNKWIIAAVLFAAAFMLLLLGSILAGGGQEAYGTDISSPGIQSSEEINSTEGRHQGTDSQQETGEESQSGTGSQTSNPAAPTVAPGQPTKAPDRDEDDGDKSNQGQNVIVKEDATYERWLAAAMTIGISMQYPDFELKDIYLTGRHALSGKAESNGVYIVFSSAGSTYMILSKPLETERENGGTTDLYSMDLGFNTFDPVETDSVDVNSMEKVAFEDLSKLIEQSLLVSLYEH